MSWIQKLCETYDSCASEIGTAGEDEIPLVPICHTTMKAQIEIVLDGDGNFRRAKILNKNESRTILPCTEKSGGRVGKLPHALCDKLQYVAADYKDFVGSEDYDFERYLVQLQKWSAFRGNPKIQSILGYVRKGRVISDLVTVQVLFAGEDGKLAINRPWQKTDKKAFDIFDLLPGRVNAKGKAETWQADAVVRWRVEASLGSPQTAVWEDGEVIQSWIDYYLSTRHETSVCYATGEVSFTAEMHPAKIRFDGDKAKLISTDDTDGFTYRGRFLNANQAATVGLLATQKAHFALRWLIGRQGYHNNGLAVVAWGVKGESVPSPTADPIELLLEGKPAVELEGYTAQDIGVRLKKKMAGYRQDLGNTTDVVVMGVDAATMGRLAIIFYRELKGSNFLAKIEAWHESCAWTHDYFTYKKDVGRGKTRETEIPFEGAPAPHDIAEVVYGPRVSENLNKKTVERLLPCIVDGMPLPRDLVELAVRQASNRTGLVHKDWKKALTIACALFRKYNSKEEYTVALDQERRTRDYLYGRLLALAESLEEWALSEGKEERPTNAARLMQRFSERPFSTWRTIELALAPYKARLGGKSKKRQRQIDEVVAVFAPEDFTSDKKLSGEFLLGYHSQRAALTTKGAVDSDDDVDGKI